MCIYSCMFKLQSSLKYFPFDAIHLLRRLFHCSKQLLNLSILMLKFTASDVFCFTSSTLAKHFPLRTFFIRGNKINVCDLRMRMGEHMGVIPFLAKNFWKLTAMLAGVLINYPSWNGQICWKSLQKQFTEAEISLSQQCQLVHWYSWVSRTLP